LDSVRRDSTGFPRVVVSGSRLKLETCPGGGQTRATVVG